MQLQHENPEHLDVMIQQIENLSKLVAKSQAKVTKLPHGAEGTNQVESKSR